MWTSFWFSWTTLCLCQAHTLFTTCRPTQDPRIRTSHKNCHWHCCTWKGWELRGSKDLGLCFISHLPRNEGPKLLHRNSGILLVAVPQQCSWLPSQSMERMKILKLAPRNSWIGVKYYLGKGCKRKDLCSISKTQTADFLISLFWIPVFGIKLEWERD